MTALLQMSGNPIHAAMMGIVSAPEPDLSPAELIARAKALAPAVREEAPAAEQRGHYSEALHQKFRDAGFYRIFVPRRFGGYAFDFPTYYRVMIEIAAADPGIGWCLALGSSHALHVATYFEPSAQEIFNQLLPRYVEVQVYRALLESNAAFFAAQMTAMDTATKNSADMISSLTLYMNKVRQAAITREIIEVVSGASAL